MPDKRPVKMPLVFSSSGLPERKIILPSTKRLLPVSAMYINRALRAVLIWLGIESFVTGIYLIPEVVPDDLAKYTGLPGQRMFSSPFFAASIYVLKPS